jgi:hypothetical protein
MATNANFPMVSIRSGEVPTGSWQLYRVFNAEPVNAGGEVDSVFSAGAPGLELAQFSTFGFYSIVAGATAVVEFKALQSFDNTAANFLIPDTDASINIINGAGSHVNVVTPTPMPFIRFRASGGAGNGADTLVTAYVFLKTS